METTILFGFLEGPARGFALNSCIFREFRKVQEELPTVGGPQVYQAAVFLRPRCWPIPGELVWLLGLSSIGDPSSAIIRKGE